MDHDDGASVKRAPEAQVLAAIEAELGDLLEPGDLDLPLEETALDSFDLITLRTALEARFGRIPDAAWGGVARLSDLAAVLTAGDGSAPAAPPAADAAADADAAVPEVTATTEAARLSRQSTLAMPQMALAGLGEPWLFKELGDAHWAMISAFLRQPTARIRDATGARLYATITRLRIEVSPHLRGFSENDPITLASTMERAGTSVYFGHHELSGPEATVAARTMSTFAKYGERGKNTSLMKGTPDLPDPAAMPELAEYPAFSDDYRARRAAEARPAVFETSYEILPPHDINGVGLLYFAAYPSIFDLAIEAMEGKGILLETSTVSKDVFYFANCEPDETLTVRIAAREEEDGRLSHAGSLHRAGDGVRMAEIESVRARIGRHVPA